MNKDPLDGAERVLAERRAVSYPESCEQLLKKILNKTLEQEKKVINSGKTQKTHWSECWQDHRECAIAKVRAMEKRYNEVLDRLAMATIRSEDHADLIRRIRELLKESEIK